MEFFDSKQPLWLPKGSIRALIAVGTLTLIGILALLGRDIPEWLIVWASTIVGAYYNMRRNQEKE